MAGQLDGSSGAAPADRGGFEVEQSWFDNVVVVAVKGDLDVLTTPHLADAIAAAAGKTPAGLIVDLSKVEFLASAGINALIAAHHKITPSARFGVVADGPATSRPLKLIGVDQLLALYRTLDDALAALNEA